MVDEQAHGRFVHPLALGEGKRAAHEATQALTQGVVEAFDVAGLARAFAGAAVRALGKDFCVGQPQVAAAGPAAVGGWDALA